MNKRRVPIEPVMVSELPSVALGSDGSVLVSAESSAQAAKLALKLFRKQSRRRYTGVEYR